MQAVKTFVLAVGFSLLALGVSAQKAEGGNFVVEGQVNSIFNDASLFAGAGQNSTSTFQGLRGRYFLSDDLAIRTTLGVNLGSTNLTFGGNDGQLNESTFGLAVGIEKHFGGTDRLSPYIGGDIFFATSSSTWEINDAGAAAATDVRERQNFNGFDATAFGLNGVIGADFYFAQNVFLGVEFGLGLQLDSQKDIEQTLVNGTTTTTEAPDGTFSFSTAAVYPTAGLRLGFVVN